MPLEVTIEPVQRGALEELAGLAARTFRDAFGQPLTQEELDASIAESRSAAYFERSLFERNVLVAKHGGKIVGYVQYGAVKIPEADATENDRELNRLYVETGLQGQDVGRQLMDAALSAPEMTRAPNIFLQVWEENPRAVSLYESYGFQKCGVTTFAFGGGTAQDLIMVRHRSDRDAA